MRKMESIYFAVMVVGILFIAVPFSSKVFAAEKNPCSNDIAKLCKNVNPENDGILKCLEMNARKLSKACSDYEGQLEDVKGNDGKVVRAKTRKTKFPYVY